MPRPRRYSPGGMVFHVLNRGVGRRMLFTKDEDFLAFERVVEESLRTHRMLLCAYCLMSNHWHFVVWPERDGDPLDVAFAASRRLVAHRQPTANAFRTGSIALLRQSRSAIRRSELGCRRSQAIEPRMDTSVTWKTKEAGVEFPYCLYLVAVTFVQPIVARQPR